MELDKDRLAKLLNLTLSQHDAEALAAIRKSNDLLRQHRTTWDAILGVSPIEEPAASSGGARPRAPDGGQPASQAEPRLAAGHTFARDYRNAFRREPFVARMLAFPFWFALELLALAHPRARINKRGRVIFAVFVISLVLSGAAWIAAAYYVVFELAG
ncbi:MAG: hypothetical protein KIT25_13545 [Enhydrobacter sp.]|nr:MAG: hypothetical protein KIT25_13545 [Enhydrobacter sp.]